MTLQYTNFHPQSKRKSKVKVEILRIVKGQIVICTEYAMINTFISSNMNVKSQVRF